MTPHTTLGRRFAPGEGIILSHVIYIADHLKPTLYFGDRFRALNTSESNEYFPIYSACL